MAWRRGLHAVGSAMQTLNDKLMERALLMLARLGSLNVFAKIALVLISVIPFVLLFGTIYHHMTETPFLVR